MIKLSFISLHSVHKSELLPGVFFTCINTDKFKSGCITVNMLCGLSHETAAANALLPRVLRRGSKNLPDMESISAALDELYGVRLEPIVRKKGEIQSVGLYCDFPDDRYIPGGESVLERAVGIVGDILLNPYMPGGNFCSDYTESEKSNLIDDIRAAINDKRGYAVDRLLEEMCAGEAYGISKLGNESEAAEITAESLTARYNEIVRNSRIEIFYCGSADFERVKAALMSALAPLPGRKEAGLPVTNIIYSPVSDTPRHFKEKLDVSQGKLTVGFRIGDTMKNPNYPALMMFNAIYGGTISSKLFLNVRERLSLCYYASSMADKHKGVMLVSSGVEFANFNTALDEILIQLENIKNGDISDWEYTAAKRSVITSIKSALDRPGGLEELYFDTVVASVSYDPVDISDMIEAVTIRDVIDIASGVKLDSVYFLCGLDFTEDNSI
ncbi:MAG: insulinase family protein [Oscillospiraceae bacterium]|nr:insulinase family protein [Oscillospiraceae bacterium]